MPLALNSEVLQTVLERQFGSKGAIKRALDAWELRFEDAPSLASFYRWLDGKWPQSPEIFWQLALVLDVDPIVLIDLDRIEQQDISNLIMSVQSGKWHVPALAYFSEFLGRRPQWPPLVVGKGLRLHWHTEDFEHTGEPKLFYQFVELDGASSAVRPFPMTYHVAYRSRSFFGGRWLQYGVIVRHNSSAVSLHINGHRQVVAHLDVADPTVFSTFFGPHPASFRVASLHPFKLRLVNGLKVEEELCFP